MNEHERARAYYLERDAPGGESEFWTLRNPVVVHLMQERERAVLRGLDQIGFRIPEARILDIGCGKGQEFASFLRWGAKKENLFGIELSPQRAEVARKLGIAEVSLVATNELPYDSGSFDMVVQNVVFSSILERSTRELLAEEMLRVLAPRGTLLWYDAAVSRSRDPNFSSIPRATVEALFPGVVWKWERLTTHLGLLRRVNSYLGESGMRAFDLLGLFKTHLLGFGKKDRPTPGTTGRI